MMAIDHWREFQPRRYARLLRGKTLYREAEAAAKLTAGAMEPLLASGATFDEAWQQVRELHVLLPEEPGTKEGLMPDSIAYAAIAEFVHDLQDSDVECADSPPDDRTRS